MGKIAAMAVAAGLVGIITGGIALAGNTDDPVIQQREANQQKRIDQGVASGRLTPREAGRLEAQQAKIKQDETRMKADGNLSRRERTKLTKEQNRASRTIFRKKHNRRTAGTS